MNLCNNCKHYKNKYCKYYKICIVDALDIKTCIAFREKAKEIKKSNIKKKSIKQEKKLAKDLGAKRTPQSGAQETSPNDMILGNYIIESKATKGKSINLKKEWLDQVKQNPINYGKIPILVLDFTKVCDRFIVMDINDFKRIIKEES